MARAHINKIYIISQIALLSNTKMELTMDNTLPNLLQITLDRLLMDNPVASWTIQGNDNLTM